MEFRLYGDGSNVIARRMIWCGKSRLEDDMPFAFLMTEYMKRLEAGDPRAIAIRESVIGWWRRIAPYLIAHRGKEWWQAGYR